MRKCCSRILMCLFCCFNVFFFIVGAAMVGIGIWVLTSEKVFIPVLQSLISSFNSMVYIFIAVGACTMFLALWGALGFFYGVRFVLLLYIPLLILICILHVFPGILIYLKQKIIQENISKDVISLIQTYNPTDEINQAKEIAWDYTQFQLSCCGWTGPENWQNNTFFQYKAGTYPCSCNNHVTSFQTALSVCTLDTISHKAAVDDWPMKNQGCGTVVQKWFKKVLDSVLLVSIIIALSEILGISLSFFFCMGRKCVC